MPIMSSFANFAARGVRNSQGFVVEREFLSGTANKTTGNTATDSVASASGDLIIVMVAWDPLSSTTPTISTVTDNRGTIYTSMGAAVSAPATASAGSGVWTQAFYGIVPSGFSLGTTTATVTFSANIDAKCVQAVTFRNTDAYQVNTRVTSIGTNTGALNLTTPIANTGDLVLVFGGFENNDAPTTGATNTTRGTWSSVRSVVTSGSGPTTNIGLGSQYKIVTGQGTQSATLQTADNGNWAVHAYVLKAS